MTIYAFFELSQHRNSVLFRILQKNGPPLQTMTNMTVQFQDYMTQTTAVDEYETICVMFYVISLLSQCQYRFCN